MLFGASSHRAEENQEISGLVPAWFPLITDNSEHQSTRSDFISMKNYHTVNVFCSFCSLNIEIEMLSVI